MGVVTLVSMSVERDLGVYDRYKNSLLRSTDVLTQLFVCFTEGWLRTWQRTAASVNFTISFCTIKKKEKTMSISSVICVNASECVRKMNFKNK